MFFICLLRGIATKATQRSQAHRMKLLYCSTPDTEGLWELLNCFHWSQFQHVHGRWDRKTGDVRSIWEFKVTDNKSLLICCPRFDP